MAITIKRNDNGACILFEGSSQPAYWYACLTAEVDGEDATRINIINDVRSTAGETEYEFYKMLFTEFLDEDGAAFADAPACIAYINDRTNPSVETGGTSFAQTEHMDFERDATNTSVMFSNGDTHGVNSIYASAESDGTVSIKTVKSDVVLYSGLNHDNLTLSLADAGGSINDVVNALNAYFAVSPVASGGDYIPSYETLAGVAVTGNDAEGETPTTGTPTHILTTAGDVSSGHGARYWSDETIDAAGEYFTVKVTGQGRFILALSDADDATMQAALLNDSGNGHSGITWGNAFYDYGSYKAPWTTYGTGGLSYGPGWSFYGNDAMMRYNTTVQDAFDNMDEVLFKVGINNEGYITVWYWDAGRTNDWIMTARRGTTTPAGNYRLVVKLWDQNSTLVETPLRVAVDPVAPVMTYHYVESPDGVFNYPLFATQEEAEHYDSGNGGAGAATQQTFIDDTQPGRIWYAPATGYTSTATSAPVDTSEITWNVVTTQADNLFAPAAFSFSHVTADELSAINLQITPADASFTTAVAFVPATPGLSIVGANIEGTLPEVTGDNVSNPSDTIVATVTRTNNFGSASASFNIVVSNLTAPATALSGFTWENTSTPLVDADTLDDGSVVHLEDTIASGQRFMISQAYVETNILPALQAAGDVVYLGIGDGAAVWTTVEDADWEMFIKWEYVSATSHRSTLQNGTTDAVVINSLTAALYDYAIEVDGTDIGVIACNSNSIMNEPSLGNGGTFSRSLLTTGYAGTIPVQVSFAAVSTQADFSTTGVSEFNIPAPANWIQVVGQPTHTLLFDGSGTMPALSAGYTYRFLMADVKYVGTDVTGLHADDDLRFTADGSTEFTTGITRVGNPNDAGAYVEFSIPAGVAPLSWYTDHNGIGSATSFAISGSVASNLTSWNKALDFSGSSQHAKQVSSSYNHNALRMSTLAVTVAAPTTSGNTSGDSNSRPWATSIVFRVDGNNSNQHIWNSGEGAGSTDDNIYLRMDASRNLFFGWGRQGALNEVYFQTMNPSNWYGLYIAHTGERLSGANATAANLSDCFSIRFVNLTTGVVGEELTTKALLYSWWYNTGGRMDRAIGGDFTIAGRGSNRNFHGKVASMVVTTLERNVAMPSDAEIKLMVTDPVKWMADHKTGQTYRAPWASNSTSNWQVGNNTSKASTQVWLMGDGTNDSYANGIRNQVHSTDQNDTKLQLNSMVSNDIETVSIPGLT